MLSVSSCHTGILHYTYSCVVNSLDNYTWSARVVTFSTTNYSRYKIYNYTCSTRPVPCGISVESCVMTSLLHTMLIYHCHTHTQEHTHEHMDMYDWIPYTLSLSLCLSLSLSLTSSQIYETVLHNFHWITSSCIPWPRPRTRLLTEGSEPRDQENHDSHIEITRQYQPDSFHDSTTNTTYYILNLSFI